jgi:hypothetical protein
MTAYKGLGTYGNAVGVVTPTDHKGAQAGQVVKASGNLIRPGLFWGGSATIISGKANMSYDVAAYQCVTTRGATSGSVFGGNDGVLNVTTTAAPGSNSRIDIIYHWHREYSLDGVDSNPVIAVIQGTAAPVPVAPSLAAFPGAIEIGRATIGAGITATTSATITQTAPFTAMAGGSVVVRSTTERDAGAWVESQRIWLLDTDTQQIYNGTTWVDARGGLVPIVPTSVAGTGVTVGTNGRVSFSGSTAISVNGCFTSAFTNYLILSDSTSASGSTPTLNMRLAGTNNVTASSYNVRRRYSSTSTYTVDTLAQTSMALTSFGGTINVLRIEVFQPAVAVATRLVAHALEATSSVPNTNDSDCVHSVATAYDGFTLTQSVSSTGTLRIYGYNDN